MTTNDKDSYIFFDNDVNTDPYSDNESFNPNKSQTVQINTEKKINTNKNMLEKINRIRFNDPDNYDLYSDNNKDSGADSGGDSGTSGAAGEIKFKIDPILFGLVQVKIRNIESKYGITPEQKDKKNSSGNQLESGIKKHPLLSKSQQFSGIYDSKNNPLPDSNEDSKEEFRNELQYRLEKQQKLQNRAEYSSAPELKVPT